MKKIYTTLVAVIAIAQFSYAQNTYPWPLNGDVGIGTNSPSQPLSVNGNTLIQNSSLTSKGYLFSSPSSNWGPQLSGLYFAPRDGVNATTDFAIKLWDGVGASATKLFIDASSSNIGIGTSIPSQPLSVNGNTLIQNSSVTSKGYLFSSPSSNWGPQLSGLYFTPRDGVNARTDFAIKLWDGVVASDTKLFIDASNGYVGIGTTTPHEALSVNGNIRSKQVKVETNNWPDYVFKPTYILPSLSEVKSYIDKYQHLPDMPSEADVAKEGLNLGDINKLLTKKVEELTLYLIEKDNADKVKDLKLQSQQQQIDELKEQIIDLVKSLKKQ